MEGGGAAISADDLALEVKAGPGRALAEGVLLRRLAAARSREEGLAVSDAEVAEALSAFYVDRDLMEPEQVDAWLAATRVSEEALKGLLAERILAGKLRERLASDEVVEASFRAHQHDWAVVRAELVELDSAGVASELALAVREGEIAWDRAVARAGGSTIVELRRRDAAAESAPLLFSAAAGSVVGPVPTESGTEAIYRILERRAAVLDAALREMIRAQVYDEALRRPLLRTPIRFL